MEYALSLVKHRNNEGAEEDVDPENATIRESQLIDSETGSPPRSASDWSMLEESSDHSRHPSGKRLSLDRRRSSGKAERSSDPKRRSLVQNVLSALPDVLTPHVLSPHPTSPTRPKAARSTSSPQPERM